MRIAVKNRYLALSIGAQNIVTSQVPRPTMQVQVGRGTLLPENTFHVEDPFSKYWAE